MTTTPPVRTPEPARKSRRLGGRPRAPTSLGHRLRLYARNPVVAIGVVALALFAYLIAAPIVSLLVDAFVVHRQDTAVTQQEEGAPTSYYLWRVLVSPQAVSIFWEPLANTLLIAVSAIVLALVIGGSAAWLLGATNMWGRKWFSMALIVPYMLPAWTFALAWVTLFKNRTTGGQAGWMENLGLTIPNWLSYGRLPIILIFAVHFSPFVIMLIGNALKSFDTTLEESSRLLGASRVATTFRIVVPILRPALISAVTLMLAKILGEFGVAYILGLPVNMNVLATSLYRNVYSDQKGSAAVMVAAIVLIGALSLWVDTHFLRESKRFVTISGKKWVQRRCGPAGRIPLGRHPRLHPPVHRERRHPHRGPRPVHRDAESRCVHRQQLHSRFLDRQGSVHDRVLRGDPPELRGLAVRVEQHLDRGAGRGALRG